MEEREIIEKELWDRYHSRFGSYPSRKYQERENVSCAVIVKISLVAYWIALIYLISLAFN